MKIKKKSFRELNLHLAAATTSRQIDENIAQFTDLMTEICDPLFSKNIKFHLPNDNLQGNFKHFSWFDDECHDLRSRFYIEVNKYWRDKTAVNQLNLARARGNFKRSIRQKRYLFEKDKTLKLTVSKQENVKEYWKILNKRATRP